MGQAAEAATVDLPDPLDSAGASADPAQAQSADDLLSQLAGDEIDRLLAESGDGAESADSPAPTAEAPAPSTAPQHKKSPLEEEMDLDAAVNAAARERMAIQDSERLNTDDTSPQIELGDGTRRLPFFLRPLEWLSSPLDPWPEQLRDLLGRIGILTLVNAIAVIAYVLIFRRHHH